MRKRQNWKQRSRQALATFLLASCAGGYASVYGQSSRPIAQTEREKYEKKLDELARIVEEQERKLDAQERLLRLAEEKDKLDDEAVRLRDEQNALARQTIAELRVTITELRTTIAELRAADTLTKDQIKALEGAVKTCESQVRKLTFTSWLTGTIGIVVTIGVFIVGILVGKGSN